ncbi:hypothetical protein BT63DRAFT_239474 [Microthyrium microscopicum]|uniref:Uncharacterized protein n=1 Tax=Microthyrium microscopicum TaxID=703497 RepID=A0A6A6UFS3_9PEZI|nr:hypothetical protein BT63DRAFT_239474 [Microthyrium microscopicum]
MDDANGISALEKEYGETRANIEWNFITKLRYTLDYSKPQGSFVASTFSTTFCSPGLDVEGCGSIPLPLCSRDAESLITQAAVRGGDGSEMNIWSFDTDQFQCRNPFWNDYFLSLTKISLDQLGILQGNIGCKPSKLVLYGKDAVFDPQKATTKIPGTFGTFILLLPSKHTGGDMRIFHAGTQRRLVIKPAPPSEYALTTLAWYSDVVPQSTLIESGYRLALTSNLYQNAGQEICTAESMMETHTMLRKLLIDWPQLMPHNKLVYIMHYQYTFASLKIDNLDGRERSAA